MSTQRYGQIGKGALDDEELFVIEGSENWRSTPGQPEERENFGKTVKKPFTATIAEKCPSLLRKCPPAPAMN